MNAPPIESAKQSGLLEAEESVLPDSLPSIELGLVEKLADRSYRQEFFLTESSALIASQLIELRKRRCLNQTQVAELINTKQPAICRVERADYHNWSFNTLRKIADALDARIRVVIEPAEDVLAEYQDDVRPSEKTPSAASEETRAVQKDPPSAATTAKPRPISPLQKMGGDNGVSEHRYEPRHFIDRDSSP
jgi:transcriptional regulator with XRE-family HTH domain